MRRHLEYLVFLHPNKDKSDSLYTDHELKVIILNKRVALTTKRELFGVRMINKNWTLEIW